MSIVSLQTSSCTVIFDRRYIEQVTDERYQNFPVFKQCDVEFVPILLGGLFKTCGNSAPITIKSTVHEQIHKNYPTNDPQDKDKWIGKERNRWANYLNIPMNKEGPPNFPPNTVPVRRIPAGTS